MVRITILDRQNKILVNPEKIKKLISNVLKLEKTKNKGELTISFTTDALIRKLNKKYLKKNAPTDVLAFDISNPKEKEHLRADIIVSTDTALRNAKEFNTTPFYELNLYSIHGLLHLLGYDDHSSKNRKLMRKKELKYVHP